MMTITPADMKALETRFMADHGVPGALLMEHAAMGVVDAIARYTNNGTALFLCGTGNNGGDGYAAARLWQTLGGKAHIVEVTDSAHGDALLNRHLAQMLCIPIERYAAEDSLPDCDVIVDALFGTGLSRAIDGTAAVLIHRANDRHRDCGTPIIAVDIPSGIDGTTGHVLGQEAICATETVTFHRIKQGLLLSDGPDHAGKLTVQPILIPEGDELDLAYDGLEILAPAELDSERFRRCATAHKGDFGRIVLFCGSRGMAGAAALCANAAMRTGAGLTTILCRESLLPILQTLAPGAMCAPLPERDGVLLPQAVDIARAALSHADAACIGCGLGQAPDLLPLLTLFTQADCPVVWDADALNLLSRHAELLPLKKADIITPHPGEAARLLGCTTAEVTEDMLSALHRLHGRCGCTVLLKGARTLITDGENRFCNLYTSPALAKGGSGDVLSGIITALLGRRFRHWGNLHGARAAAYGALIHGLSGIRAAQRHGESCTLPTDLVDCIRLDSQGIDWYKEVPG
ncbi:MAG: NAD(P)H-hydrate dehydratase [Clostridiales bacterium]|nr:NAD(P)H-hydrate dehydratase [Clostridiales bacterium]